MWNTLAKYKSNNNINNNNPLIMRHLSIQAYSEAQNMKHNITTYKKYHVCWWALVTDNWN